MTSQFISRYLERYDNDMYRNDSTGEHQRVIAVLKAAAQLSAEAQAEFAKVFNYEDALDGMVYVGRGMRARRRYPNLMAEAAGVGIKLQD